MGDLFDDLLDEEEYSYSDYEKKERKRDKTRAVLTSNSKWVIFLLMEIIVLTILIVATTEMYFSNKWNEADVNDILPEELMINKGANKDMDGYTLIALFGLDSRDGSLESGNHSDSMMVACIDKKTKNIKLVSLYRDTLMEIPGHSLTAKANTAYAYGGGKLAVQMLNTNFDLGITEYVALNWEGMTRVIDALGGVTVHVEESEIDQLNSYIIEQISTNSIMSLGVNETGFVTLNGVQATAYSRIKNTDQGDITRTERQREVMEAMFAKLKKADMEVIDKALTEIFQYVSTSITEKEMLSIVKDIRNYKLESTVGFPAGYEYYEDERKGSVLVPANLSQNVTALHEYLFGTTAYVPTDTVTNINDRIMKETGFGDEGPIRIQPRLTEDE